MRRRSLAILCLELKSASVLAQTWPTRIIRSRFEIGIALRYPHQRLERDYNYVDHHLLKDAYYAYNPLPHDRPTWDLTSVLDAIRPNRHYFGLPKSGNVSLDKTGLTHFRETKNKQQHLKLNASQMLRVKETLVGLARQPPNKSN